jgi:hypothetical protein
MMRLLISLVLLAGMFTPGYQPQGSPQQQLYIRVNQLGFTGAGAKRRSFSARTRCRPSSGSSTPIRARSVQGKVDTLAGAWGQLRVMDCLISPDSRARVITSLKSGLRDRNDSPSHYSVS